MTQQSTYSNVDSVLARQAVEIVSRDRYVTRVRGSDATVGRNRKDALLVEARGVGYSFLLDDRVLDLVVGRHRLINVRCQDRIGDILALKKSAGGRGTEKRRIRQMVEQHHSSKIGKRLINLDSIFVDGTKTCVDVGARWR